MSNNNELKVTSNSNESIDWIEEAIEKNYFKHFEYKNFSNIQKVGSGGFGKVYRANWNNSHQYLALKSFSNLNNATAKEIVHEVIIIIQYFGLVMINTSKFIYLFI